MPSVVGYSIIMLPTTKVSVTWYFHIGSIILQVISTVFLWFTNNISCCAYTTPQKLKPSKPEQCQTLTFSEKFIDKAFFHLNEFVHGQHCRTGWGSSSNNRWTSLFWTSYWFVLCLTWLVLADSFGLRLSTCKLIFYPKLFLNVCLPFIEF